MELVPRDGAVKEARGLNQDGSEPALAQGSRRPCTGLNAAEVIHEPASCRTPCSHIWTSAMRISSSCGPPMRTPSSVRLSDFVEAFLAQDASVWKVLLDCQECVHPKRNVLQPNFEECCSGREDATGLTCIAAKTNCS